MANSSLTHTLTETKIFDGQVEHNIEIHKLACVADDTNGSFSLATTKPMLGVIYQFVWDPGGTAPQDLCDGVLTHPTHGYDIAGGALTNLATATTQLYFPEDGATNIFPKGILVEGITPTFTVTNNNVNSATWDLYIYLKKAVD